MEFNGIHYTCDNHIGPKEWEPRHMKQVYEVTIEQLKSDLLVAQQALATEKMVNARLIKQLRESNDREYRWMDIAEMRRLDSIELRAARDGLASAAMEAEDDYQFILRKYKAQQGITAEWSDKYYKLWHSVYALTHPNGEL